MPAAPLNTAPIVRQRCCAKAAGNQRQCNAADLVAQVQQWMRQLPLPGHPLAERRLNDGLDQRVEAMTGLSVCLPGGHRTRDRTREEPSAKTIDMGPVDLQKLGRNMRLLTRQRSAPEWAQHTGDPISRSETGLTEAIWNAPANTLSSFDAWHAALARLVAIGPTLLLLRQCHRMPQRSGFELANQRLT